MSPPTLISVIASTGKTLALLVNPLLIPTVLLTVHSIGLISQVLLDLSSHPSPWGMAWQPTPVFFLEIPWTEKPGGLQGSQKVGHD